MGFTRLSTKNVEKDQIFGQGFDQGFEQGENHKDSVQYYAA